MSSDLRSIGGTGGVFRPPWPAIEQRCDRTILLAVGGERWAVADVREGETPRVYRQPPDPAATLRVYRRLEDGLIARVELAVVRPRFEYHGLEDGSPQALSLGLQHALDRTPSARERLAR